MNHLLDLLSKENIIFDLDAVTKDEVIQKLVDKAISSQMIKNEEKTEVVQCLLNREKSMSTGIGSGVAIPHCSLNIIEDLKCVMAISKSGIEFESIDHLPVHIFIMLLVPKLKFQEHIKTLALIAKTLNIKSERDKLISSGSYEEIATALSSIKS